ncbi:methanol dehydrogenase (cytochrome c) subunit 2 [Angulomicrobium tetraedrale]|uniref:Methanol dehydrogenase (Cytochrome c) subunit 2 n=1 Tax=Ancylobacter tetraedralis TaxID=217068 RepID=A0A839Z882_9HYPH|nr:methanol dehydrogenase [cytochrome c] subunit [Ancylobacter tetraedralis]MBB3769547.1 methanol dehydrogenase (cytochrome c) subunit 2 [Ancylobacter tetraedralis]
MRATKGTTTRLVDQSLKFSCLIAGTAAFGLAMVVGAAAYDGTNCKAPGNCWEPKPGYPAQVAGSKYDPKHDPRELNKQQESIKGMEARNAQRVEYFQKTGKFVYDVSKIPSAN